MPAIGFDGSVSESEFGRIMALSGPRGIVRSPADWVITPTANAREISVSAGAGLLTGVRWDTTGAQTVAATSNVSGSTRYDLVVWRGNWTANTVTLTVLPGTPGLTVPPAADYSLLGVGTVYDLPICVLRIISGGGVLTGADIYDIRPYGGVGGVTVPQWSFAGMHDLVAGHLWVDASTGKMWRVNTAVTDFDHVGWSEPALYAEKTADQNYTGTSKANDTHLLTTVRANATYRLTCVLFAQHTTDAADVSIDFTHPGSGTVVDWGGLGPHNAALSGVGSSGDGEWFAAQNQTASPTAAIPYACRTGGPVIIKLEGRLKVGTAAGTFRLRGSQQTATGTTTLKAGSWMCLDRVA